MNRARKRAGCSRSRLERVWQAEGLPAAKKFLLKLFQKASKKGGALLTAILILNEDDGSLRIVRL
ncbi:hypothetical protein [Komagataeibacter xylinus]|uniref:hypothetical protein n=1 Tax=Komagataeibacter xylinus TaxID=28448 RepID=UPI00102FE6BE|nr:hypothetical protein [Komagataeibacter xylinus]